VEHDRSFAEAWNNLGVVLSDLGRDKEAVLDSKRHCRINRATQMLITTSRIFLMALAMSWLLAGIGKAISIGICKANGRNTPGND
jgi:hypothetical protein